MSIIYNDTKPGNTANQYFNKQTEGAKSELSKLWPNTKETLKYSFNYDIDQNVLSKWREILTGAKTSVDITVGDTKDTKAVQKES